MTKSFRFIDLFSGIGGFHHALAQLGGECVLACELDREARHVYRKSFARKNGAGYRFVRNIRSLTRHDIADAVALKSPGEIRKSVPGHDVLCGGFPCQPFSKSGAQEGVNDRTRGTLFHDIVQIIEARHPKYVFLENVKNLVGPRHRDTWQTVITSIRAQGYHVLDEPMIFSPHLLPRVLGGAPQVRERVFIFGVRNDIDPGCLFRLADFNRHLRERALFDPDQWRISDFLLDDEDLVAEKGLALSTSDQMYLEAWNYFVEKIPATRLPGFPLWAFAFVADPEVRQDMPLWEVSFRQKNSDFYRQHRRFIDRWKKMRWSDKRLTVGDFPLSRQKLEWQASRWHSPRSKRSLGDLVLQLRPSGIRVKPPTYLPALVAIAQTSIVGPLLRSNPSLGYRRISPREAAKLQSLPDSIYEDTEISSAVAYKQLGNAVNVGIVRTAARILLGFDSAESLIAQATAVGTRRQLFRSQLDIFS